MFLITISGCLIKCITPPHNACLASPVVKNTVFGFTHRDFVESCCSQVSPCITGICYDNGIWHQDDKNPSKWHENKEHCSFTRFIHIQTFIEHTAVGNSLIIIIFKNLLHTTLHINIRSKSLCLCLDTLCNTTTRQLCSIMSARTLPARQHEQR